MFAWYKAAQLCAVHLADVSDPHDLDSFGRSVWFTRGWTLQELLAPATLTFYTADWQIIGNKDSLAHAKKVSQVTGIPERMLKSPDILHNVSVARRMSWAAGRQTSRIEDLAYCLLGIFDINMPLLYGEGPKAFWRLQMEIMDQLDDESLFAWQDDASTAESATHGLLAKSPSKFASCGNVVTTQTPSRMESPPIRMTSRGAEVFSELSETYSSTAEGQPVFVYTLGCGTTHNSSYCLDNLVGGDLLRVGKVRPCSIALARKSESASFTRIDAGRPISNLTSKYIHASYVRPTRFYIQTSWSGAATFSRIYTGRRPKYRSHSPDKVTRQAGQLMSSLSVSEAPYRSVSTRAKLTTTREETAIKLITSSSATPRERKSSDQSDLEITPVTSTDTRNQSSLEFSERSTESFDEFNFAAPEFLETEGVSRSKSRRKQHSTMPTLEENNVTFSSTQGNRANSFSQEEVEAAMEGLGPLLANLSKRFGVLAAADAEAAQSNEDVEAAQDGASPINSDPEAEKATPVKPEHTSKVMNVVIPSSSEISPENESQVGDEHSRTPRPESFSKRNRDSYGKKQYPDLPINPSNTSRRYSRRSPVGDRSRGSPVSPSPDGTKELRRKRRNSSIKTALLAEDNIDDVGPGSGRGSPSGLGIQDYSSGDDDPSPSAWWRQGSAENAAVKFE